jgi:glycosyltransferase involved in cell wall biosynthesis
VIVTLRPGWMTERAQGEGFPVWIEPQRRGFDAGWIPRLAWRLRRRSIELVHSHEFAMNAYAGAAARLAGLPTVATVHGRQWVTDRARRVWSYKLLRRAGMRLVAVSRDLAAFLETRMGLSPGAIEVVHNGIRLPPMIPAEKLAGRRAAARRELAIPPDGPLLVAVGNLYPVKDHATLLRAAASPPLARVAIAGRGSEEASLKRLAGELGIADRVHLLGLRDDIDRVLLAADVFVQPSRSEGLPLSILEAMGAGLPVVATAVGGIPEAVVAGKTGALVPAGDPAALAEALRCLLERPDRGHALGCAGRTRAAEEFSIAAMVDRYQVLYAQAAGFDVEWSSYAIRSPQPLEDRDR